MNLLFAEIFFGPGCSGGGPGTGARVFDIELEGAPMEAGFDIFAEGGCAASTTDPTTVPVVRSYQIAILDGSLDILLPARSTTVCSPRSKWYRCQSLPGRSCSGAGSPFCWGSGGDACDNRAALSRLPVAA